MSELDRISINDSYNQYKEYTNLPKLLKRYSLDEKMRVACLQSSRVMDFGGKMGKENSQYLIPPWCLETFVMLALEADEYNNGRFEGKGEKRFWEIINTIWAASGKVFENYQGRFDFIDVFFPVSLLTQFPTQESYRIKLFRFWNVFRNNSEPIHLKELFKQKFGADYYDYLMLAETLYTIIELLPQIKSVIIPQKVISYLIIKRFPEATRNLMISREEYVRLQKEYVQGSNDPYRYTYSVRPSFQYAFVSAGNMFYFPLPHLIVQNVTTSLMYRLTEGENQLRTDIGLYIWEPYLLNLMHDGIAHGLYEEVLPEQEYTYKGSKSQSPDVLVRNGEDILFMDSKSTVPSAGIRTLNEKAYETHISIVGGYIAKLYRQICRFQLYNPFPSIEREDCKNYWGVIVVLEDSHIGREFYFEKARVELKLSKESDEFKWICEHIQVAGLYDIELMSLTGQSVIDACKNAHQDTTWKYSFSGSPDEPKPFVSKSFREFEEMLHRDFKVILGELREHGCFNK